MSKKRKVLAYFHTHWDREWYRDFESFRLRLISVFDHILNMLTSGKLPSFYFDGQVSALEDYLELRPEKEDLIRKLIKNKKLFIGPSYCLVDEFLTDGITFRKNLELGIRIAKKYGCNDFIGYLADTFGHSKNIPLIFKEFGIDKAVVWRGCSKDIPADFRFRGLNTVNLIRGYFMDIFSSSISLEEKAEFLKKNLDIIAEKSSDILLLPIGADHLDIPDDILQQIKAVNKLLEDYEIIPSDLFKYFNSVKFNYEYKNELRDNDCTFILQGTCSSRLDLKKLNTECSYKLNLANKLQQEYELNYNSTIDYAYKLLLKNQAHDSICGCSIDSVHEENKIRYKKILQIANYIFEEVKFKTKSDYILLDNPDKYRILEIESEKIPTYAQVISKRNGFSQSILMESNKIPITEDYTRIYKVLTEVNSDNKPSDLTVTESSVSNSNIKITVDSGQINLTVGNKTYENFIEFVRCNDLGDSYNFGPQKDDVPIVAKINNSKKTREGHLSCGINIDTTFFNVQIFLNKKSKLLNFKIEWCNLLSNKLWQVKFNFDKDVKTVYSEDMNTLITRTFDPSYNIYDNLPKTKGLEAKTNTAPFQRFVWFDNCGIITKGLTEYEVKEKSLLITLLRSTGIISNPQNPARTTPAGPPLEVKGLQQFGKNVCEFSVGFFDVEEWQNYIDEIYPLAI